MPQLKSYVSVAVIVLQLLHVANCNEPTYAVTAPKIIRPRADYNVIVSLHDVEKDTEVTCTLKQIKNSNDHKTSTIISTQVINSKDPVQIFNMKIGLEFSDGKYMLNVIGNGGIKFNESMEVEFLYKQFVILVQTDKAIYKPGQDVLFRVLLLDENLIPVNKMDISDMKIYIMDPLDNKLRQFSLNPEDKFGANKFNYTKGVTNDIKFTMHSEAMPGSWKIQAVTRGQVQNYTFFVDYYTLPLANVTITLPQYVTYKEPNMIVKVDCFYTFGKPVKGSLKLIVSKIKECGKYAENLTSFTINNLDINGQFTYKLDLRDTLLLNPNCAEMTFNITAVVNDSITHSIYTNLEQLDVYEQNLRAEQIVKPKAFKPGTLVRHETKVIKADGTAIEETVMKKLSCKAKLKNTTGSFFDTVATEISRKDNIIACDFVTETTTASMQFTLAFQDQIITKSEVQSLSNCKPVFIQVLHQEPLSTLNVGGKTNLVITSNEPINQFIYYIVVRGSIVNASTVKFPEGDNGPKLLELQLTREMVPEVVVAVFFASPNSGVIVSDAITLQVSGLFHNLVQFDVKASLVDASEKAKFNIEAEPYSELFLLAVDEAVLALKQGNDIIEKRVLKELRYIVNTGQTATGFSQSGMTFRTNAHPECGNKFSYYSVDIVDNNDDSENVHKSNTIRKDFRETWIWDRVTMHDKRRITLSSEVPDSITSWKLTAFAVHDEKGLGLTQTPGHVIVFRPFFLRLNLPYSIRREETTEIHILVFNYLNDTADIQLNVTSNNTKDVLLSNCSFTIKMTPNEIKTFTCNVTAHSVGSFNLSAEATAITNAKTDAKTYKDGELKSLLVIYEGFTVNIAKAVMFDFTKEEVKEITDKVSINYPDNIVIGSQKVFASATAELITTTWKDSLQSMVTGKSIKADFSHPTGCCEQRVVKYFPTVYLLEFLVASNKTSDEVISNARDQIQIVISMLCFQNPNDGSFVPWTYYHEWGNTVIAGDTKSSTWQTANILKLLTHTKKFIPVDKNIIDKARAWLKRQQLSSGEFSEADNSPERRVVVTHSPEMYLTSFVYISLYSDTEKPEKNSTALMYLSANFANLHDPYDIVITCYVFHLANHEKRDQCFSEMMKLSRLENNMRYWTGSNNKTNLQTTAYALMILVERKSNANALEVFRYLLSKQLSNGWFSVNNEDLHSIPAISNSLTTIICTEALTKFVLSLQKYDPKVENIFVNFKVESNEKQTLHIKPENKILQSLELDNNAREVEITASGYGRALARVYWQFNVMEINGTAFDITAKKVNLRGSEYINIDVCSKYKLEDKAINAIIEIDLPSGYTYDKSGQKNVSKLVDKIESINSDTHINVYLKEITKEPVCISIPAIQSHAVQNTKPVPIKVYPYYDTSKLSVHQLNVDL